MKTNVVDFPKRYITDGHWDILARGLEALFKDKFEIKAHEKDGRIYIETKDRENEDS